MFSSDRSRVHTACRELKKLFKEARERSVKALSFAKRLRNDLGVAAKFSVNVTINELLEKLKQAGYTQVIKISLSVSDVEFQARRGEMCSNQQFSAGHFRFFKRH